MISPMRIGLLWLVGACWCAQAQVAPASDPVAMAIAAELDALLSPEVTAIHGAQIAMGDRMREFYSRREFRPAWTNARTAEQLLKALADSYDDGLDPADYHLPLLRELAAQVAAPASTATLKAQYDILLTEALLRLGYHLSFGKVDPESFDTQWNYGRTLAGMDVAQEIENAIAADNVYERLAALRPTHSMYVRLKQELARYRAIEKEGGWGILPSGAALKPGARDARVSALRTRMVRSGDLADATASDPQLYDAPLIAAVKQYQKRLGLEPDGAVGPGTIAQLNVPVADRITQLRVNLDRGRVLLHDLPQRFVVVNIAGYFVYLVQGNEVVWSARAQVGKAYRRTPIFRSTITYLVWNPTWTVPPGIIRNDILPAARRDPSSITRRGLKVLDGNGREVNPASIDWSRFSSGNIPYTLRQDPGPSNALGRVKLMFPNGYLVYLHDTPSQALFERAERAFSSGCVRVERATELARLVLDDPAWDQAAVDRVLASGRLQNVTLKNKVPVLLAYWTAWQDPQGLMNFRSDLYGQDGRWATALNAPFKVRKRPLFSADAAAKT
ncbi:MAG TPA: L,D-transpeptidase family protein [Povalibacter sp.]|nr:L,D-transpeptidase family protein [Povalibacter sp.]